jgi:hypothetical protein
MLSDAKCDEFRRLPGTFNTMIRAAHDDGKKQALKATISEFCTVRWYDGDECFNTAMAEVREHLLNELKKVVDKE